MLKTYKSGCLSRTEGGLSQRLTLLLLKPFQGFGALLMAVDNTTASEIIRGHLHPYTVTE
jgi:hypothetical protein